MSKDFYQKLTLLTPFYVQSKQLERTLVCVVRTYTQSRLSAVTCFSVVVNLDDAFAGRIVRQRNQFPDQNFVCVSYHPRVYTGCYQGRRVR